MDTRQRHNHSASPLTGTITRRSAVAQAGALAALLAVAPRGRVYAQQTPAEAPNTFRLTGTGTEITYATTSFTGEPTLTYHGPEYEVDFSGMDISEADSPFGPLVSVKLDFAPDGYTLFLTVILPHINLADNNAPTPFSTLGILTRHLDHIGGPHMIEGATTTYEAVELEGSAEMLHY